MFKGTYRQHKKPLIIAVVAIAIIIVAIATNHLRFRNPIVFLDQPQQVQSGQKNIFSRFGPAINGVDVNGRTTGVATADEDAYQAAVRLYSGRVIHFNDNCQAAPAAMILSGQSVVVLDNQSAVTRSIAVADREYTIAPQNFILVSFDKAATYPVTCDDTLAGYITAQ